MPCIKLDARTIVLILESRFRVRRDIEGARTLNIEFEIIGCCHPDALSVDTVDVNDIGCFRSPKRCAFPNADTGAIIPRQVTCATKHDNQVTAFIILNSAPGVARGALGVDGNIVHEQGVGTGIVRHPSTLDVVVHDVVTVVAGDHGASHIEAIVGGCLRHCEEQ